MITTAQAERGYKLIGKSADFAFVRAANNDVVPAIPVRKELAHPAFSLGALDFLKFLQGVKEGGDIWKYFMTIGGLHRISITESRDCIHFEKMPEVEWKNILPSMKSMLQLKKNLLLPT